ncbi:MFS transporter [Cryobacterium breve]|uniref:MFS transporter n=2 Tax=Microbacteriaceae TaxID=85023 RepID=A0ABY2J4I9_9MICO|nr:MFS transporter [Cryobacterium sp. TmT3-12]TFC99770.1 MFS transporter [Cryobacterium breve]
MASGTGTGAGTTGAGIGTGAGTTGAGTGTGASTESKTQGRRFWLAPAAAIFAVAWGGNEFTPLLVMYRQDDGFSNQLANLLLGAYVLGIIPALLIAGPLSDRFGRRPLMLPAPWIAIAGSVLLAVSAGNVPLLLAGRILSGVALGLAMAVGTSWVKELSAKPFDRGADLASGARRATIALSLGFALGAASSGVLAQWAPFPGMLPYAAHTVIAMVFGLLLLRTPESQGLRTPESQGLRTPESQGLRTPPGALLPARPATSPYPRFLLLIVPVAPWVFGTATTAYAVLPALAAAEIPSAPVAFAALLCVVALVAGASLQLFSHRITAGHNARGIMLALMLTIGSLLLASVAVSPPRLWLILPAAALLGAAYGLMMVSGLQEVQRIAPPDHLARLTAIYYGITYLGFFVPLALSLLEPWLGYPVMFAGGAGVSALSLVLVLVIFRRDLSLHSAATK